MFAKRYCNVDWILITPVTDTSAEYWWQAQILQSFA